MEVNFKSPSLEKTEAEAEVEENMRFHKSLQELRELQSQLHHAADYCETTFLKSEAKRDVLENTKEYICRAMVTVVDHLGNVSANLDGLISQTNAFSEADSRIQCLKQRLFSCEQYADKLALTKMRWREKVPRLHTRYLSSPPILERSSSEKLRDSSKTEDLSKLEDKHMLEKHEDLPLFLYTQKPHGDKNLKPTSFTTLKEHNLTMGTTLCSSNVISTTFVVLHDFLLSCICSSNLIFFPCYNHSGTCSGRFVSLSKSFKSYISLPKLPEGCTP